MFYWIYFILFGHSILYLDYLPIFDSFFSIFRYLCFLFILPQFLQQKSNYNSLFFASILYIFASLFIAIHFSLRAFPSISIGITSLTLIMTIAVELKKDGGKKVLKDLSNVLCFYISLNFILILLKPEGVWLNYNDRLNEDMGYYIIGGNRNQMGATLLVGLIVTALNYYKNSHEKKKLIYIVVCSIISLLITGSKTSTVGIIIFSLFLLIRSDKIKKLAIIGIFCGFFVYQWFIMYSISDLASNSIVQYAVEDVLEKDLSFSGRATIWVNTLYKISESPIFGWGRRDKEWNLNEIGGVYTHNLILENLYVGGIILLTAFMIFVLVGIFRGIKQRKTIFFKTSIFGFGTFLIMNVTEGFALFYFAVLLSLVYYTKEFTTKHTDKKIDSTLRTMYTHQTLR